MHVIGHVAELLRQSGSELATSSAKLAGCRAKQPELAKLRQSWRGSGKSRLPEQHLSKSQACLSGNLLDDLPLSGKIGLSTTAGITISEWETFWG